MFGFSFDFSPFKRCTFWGLIVGSFIGQLTIYGSSQTMLQRYMSISNVRKSQMYVTSGFQFKPTLSHKQCPQVTNVRHFQFPIQINTKS